MRVCLRPSSLQMICLPVEDLNSAVCSVREFGRPIRISMKPNPMFWRRSSHRCCGPKTAHTSRCHRWGRERTIVGGPARAKKWRGDLRGGRPSGPAQIKFRRLSTCANVGCEMVLSVIARGGTSITAIWSYFWPLTSRSDRRTTSSGTAQLCRVRVGASPMRFQAMEITTESMRIHD